MLPGRPVILPKKPSMLPETETALPAWGETTHEWYQRCFSPLLQCIHSHLGFLQKPDKFLLFYERPTMHISMADWASWLISFASARLLIQISFFFQLLSKIAWFILVLFFWPCRVTFSNGHEERASLRINQKYHYTWIRAVRIWNFFKLFSINDRRNVKKFFDVR